MLSTAFSKPVCILYRENANIVLKYQFEENFNECVIASNDFTDEVVQLQCLQKANHAIPATILISEN